MKKNLIFIAAFFASVALCAQELTIGGEGGVSTQSTTIPRIPPLKSVNLQISLVVVYNSAGEFLFETTDVQSFSDGLEAGVYILELHTNLGIITEEYVKE